MRTVDCAHTLMGECRPCEELAEKVRKATLKEAAQALLATSGISMGSVYAEAAARVVSSLSTPLANVPPCDVCGKPSTCGASGDNWCRVHCPDCDNYSPKCQTCGKGLKRGPIGGGHFDWLECCK